MKNCIESTHQSKFIMKSFFIIFFCNKKMYMKNKVYRHRNAIKEIFILVLFAYVPNRRFESDIIWNWVEIAFNELDLIIFRFRCFHLWLEFNKRGQSMVFFLLFFTVINENIFKVSVTGDIFRIMFLIILFSVPKFSPKSMCSEHAKWHQQSYYWKHHQP